MDKILAIQFECGNLIADGFNRARRRFPNCLPDLFKNVLNLLRNGGDVGIHRYEFWLAGHRSKTLAGSTLADSGTSPR